jgi:hypothetical protein
MTEKIFISHNPRDFQNCANCKTLNAQERAAHSTEQKNPENAHTFKFLCRIAKRQEAQDPDLESVSKVSRDKPSKTNQNPNCRG